MKRLYRMLRITGLTILVTLNLCSWKNTLGSNFGNVYETEIYQRQPGNNIKIKEGFEKEFKQETDTIAGQLMTVEKLKRLMSEKKYHEAVFLFSKRQQEKINKIKDEPKHFNIWCEAWTLDYGKYERFVKTVKSGNGIFVFEDSEWRIDEN